MFRNSAADAPGSYNKDRIRCLLATDLPALPVSHNNITYLSYRIGDQGLFQVLPMRPGRPQRKAERLTYRFPDSCSASIFGSTAIKGSLERFNKSGNAVGAIAENPSPGSLTAVSESRSCHPMQ
jgi:hypothetical protein